MVFPVENEDRTMRNLLMLCQDHARLVVEMFRNVLLMVENLVKGDIEELSGSLEEVKKLHDSSLDIKRTMMKELADTGGMLMDREDLYRLITKSGEVIDYIEGIGVRLWEMCNWKWEIPPEMGEDLVKLAEAAFYTLTKLRESILSLGLNSFRAISLTRDVDDGERKVDSLYRALDLSIITSKVDLPLILLLRNVAEIIEKMVDRAREEADLIRILAL